MIISKVPGCFILRANKNRGKMNSVWKAGP